MYRFLDPYDMLAEIDPTIGVEMAVRARKMRRDVQKKTKIRAHEYGCQINPSLETRHGL